MDGDGRIGELIGDAGRRAAWRDFVLALHEAALPGGPLEGHLFHGTHDEPLATIEWEGVTTTECFHEDGEGGWTEGTGTHWATPKVAAFYAEDRIESRDDPDLGLAILAVPVSALSDAGPFAVDGQTLDAPIYTRLGRSEAETDAMWEASAKDWKACLDVFGTLLVLGPLGPGEAVVLRGRADVEELCRSIAPQSPVP